MNCLIRNYFGNLTKVLYGALAIGGLSVTLAVYFTKRPVVEIVKSPMAFAIGCNLIAAIYIAVRSKKGPINRAELLQRLQAGEITAAQVMRQHGWLMCGALVIFFWAGWMSCGMFLAFINS